MKQSSANQITLLLLAALLAITFTARAQNLISESMEGYSTATSTSILRNAASSVPQYWESVPYAGSGSATMTAGIGTANGNPGRAAVMNGNFSAASTYAGAILNSATYGSGTPATQGNAFFDFHFAVDLRGSQ